MLEKESDEVLKVVNPITGVERIREVNSTRKRSRFIGTSPVSWWAAVSPLPKCAYQTGLALHLIRGLRGRDTFKLEPARFRELGIDRSAQCRGLVALEQAGLIRLKRQSGKAPVVTIILVSIQSSPLNDTP